jgi:hypothetical protein
MVITVQCFRAPNNSFQPTTSISTRWENRRENVASNFLVALQLNGESLTVAAAPLRGIGAQLAEHLSKRNMFEQKLKKCVLCVMRLVLKSRSFRDI